MRIRQPRRSLAVLASVCLPFAIAAFSPAAALAQPCTPQWVGDIGTPGSNGYVGAFATHNFGQGKRVFAGGAFTRMANISAAKGVAQYNPATNTWSAMGGGVFTTNTNYFVAALTTYNTPSGVRLLVGGWFATASNVPQQRVNVLLCTTIIETGIDNPHANTIVINRAEKFGLAQLHQLRGRVGRSHHQAYAYLLTHDDAALNKQARQRLEAIQMMDELGAGFYLAMHDLEIRGAGEVLGANQSGEMQEVGFNLFTEMLNRAVAAYRRSAISPIRIA